MANNVLVLMVRVDRMMAALLQLGKWCLWSAQPSCCEAKQHHLLQVVRMLSELPLVQLCCKLVPEAFLLLGLLQQAVLVALQCSMREKGGPPAHASTHELDWQA